MKKLLSISVLLGLALLLVLNSCQKEEPEGRESLKVGDHFEGGIIAYILQPNDPGYVQDQIHGIIAAPSDQEGRVPWGCNGTSIGATGIAIGTGASNTAKIIVGCSEVGIAARLCDELVLNGYNDWYLSSKNELDTLYVNMTAIGGFAGDYYWSSSEDYRSSFYAWYRLFDSESYSVTLKTNTMWVRAVRAF